MDYTKVIETKYNGITFRSRTEARIALLLDLFEIVWWYEPEGFDVNGNWYLPDFYLPDHDCFWEVKAFPDQVNKKVKNTLIAFTSQVRKPIILSVGTPKVKPLIHDNSWINFYQSHLRYHDGFKMHGIIGYPWDTWTSSHAIAEYINERYQQSFRFNDEHGILWFIEKEFGFKPKTRKEAVKLDQKYYSRKYKKPHPRYELGRHYNLILDSSNGKAFFSNEDLGCQEGGSIYEKVASWRF